MAACILTSQRRFSSALPLWRRASSQDPQHVWAWYGLGYCYDRLSQPAQAAACYTACIALKPDFHGWYFSRGLIYLKQKDYALATADFNEALRLRPDCVEARFNRALARLGTNRCSEAVVDFEDLIRQGHDDVRTHLLLAEAREKAGDMEGAERARVAGMRCQPSDDAAWVSRAIARCKNDPAGAVEDLDRALNCNAFCLPAMESKANLLAERLGRTADAVRALDQAVAAYPENGSLLAARGVLLARLDRRALARHDAQAALALDHSAATAYQVAGIYALLWQQQPADLDRAIALIGVRAAKRLWRRLDREGQGSRPHPPASPISAVDTGFANAASGRERSAFRYRATYRRRLAPFQDRASLFPMEQWHDQGRQN